MLYNFVFLDLLLNLIYLTDFKSDIRSQKCFVFFIGIFDTEILKGISEMDQQLHHGQYNSYKQQYGIKNNNLRFFYILKIFITLYQ